MPTADFSCYFTYALNHAMCCCYWQQGSDVSVDAEVEGEEEYDEEEDDGLEAEEEEEEPDPVSTLQYCVYGSF